MRLKIAGGHVFDPAQGWKGEVRDLYIQGERMAEDLAAVDQVVDAAGRLVVPGGIDLRAQVATYGVNFLRLWGELPSPADIARIYLELGYTHIHEPFLTPTTAPAVHRELAALPWLDTSASLVLNCRDLDLWLKEPARLPELAETVGYLLEQTRSLAVRVVEPWVQHRQEFYRHRTLTPEATLEILARLAAALEQPLQLEASPVVLTVAWPEKAAFHLAGLGQALESEELLAAAEAKLREGVSADMGLIYPETPGHPHCRPAWVDLGLSRPLNLAPPREREQARRTLHLALATRGERLAFSGAGAFQAPVARYPELLAWLRDEAERRRFWGEPFIEGFFEVMEWVYATRTLPARVLGLADCGHLGPGARADVAIFDLPGNHAPFDAPGTGHCRTLLKAGSFVVRDYALVEGDIPRTTWYRRTNAARTAMAEELLGSRSFRPEHWEIPADGDSCAFREAAYGHP
jgi:formylmethanofuran dehydrogenase subunit A